MQKTVIITDYDHFGRGITKLKDKIVFVNNALKNEEVSITITKEHKNYIEANTQKIIRSNENRVEPICPYYNICGGCNLMHMSYQEQLNFKQSKITNIINKYVKQNIKINKIVSTNQYNYRNKITLKVKNNILGYYQEETNNLVKIDKCYLADDKINDLIKSIKQHDLKNYDQIIIRASKNLDESMILFKDNNSFILEKLGNYIFKISGDSFFQVNTKGAEIMYQQVLDYLDLKGTENILDLYCGTGTISIYISNHANHVTGIEINKDAIRDANYNKKINHIKNLTFINDDVKNIEIKQYDVVIIDPPRSGINQETINKIIEINPKKIVYVSCDPMTLARDLNILKEKYNIEEITPIDMFPNTYHVECVTVLHRK